MTYNIKGNAAIAKRLDVGSLVTGLSGRQLGRISINGSVDMLGTEPARDAGAIYRHTGAMGTDPVPPNDIFFVTDALYQADGTKWELVPVSAGVVIYDRSTQATLEFNGATWVSTDVAEPPVFTFNESATGLDNTGTRWADWEYTPLLTGTYPLTAIATMPSGEGTLRIGVIARSGDTADGSVKTISLGAATDDEVTVSDTVDLTAGVAYHITVEAGTGVAGGQALVQMMFPEGAGYLNKVVEIPIGFDQWKLEDPSTTDVHQAIAADNVILNVRAGDKFSGTGSVELDDTTNVFTLPDRPGRWTVKVVLVTYHAGTNSRGDWKLESEDGSILYANAAPFLGDGTGSDSFVTVVMEVVDDFPAGATFRINSGNHGDGTSTADDDQEVYDYNVIFQEHPTSAIATAGITDDALAGLTTVDLNASAAPAPHNLDDVGVTHLINVLNADNGGAITAPSGPVIGKAGIGQYTPDVDGNVQILAAKGLATPVFTVNGSDTIGTGEWFISLGEIQLTRSDPAGPPGQTFVNSTGDVVEWRDDDSPTFDAFENIFGGREDEIPTATGVQVRHVPTGKVFDVNFTVWDESSIAWAGSAEVPGDPIMGWILTQLGQVIQPGTENLFLSDATLQEDRVHTMNANLEFSRKNTAGNYLSRTRITPFNLSTDFRDYQADGTTLLSRMLFTVSGSAVSLNGTGEWNLSVNSYEGAPGMVIASKGALEAPRYVHQNMVEIDSIIDLTTAEPAHNATTNGMTVWNTGTGNTENTTQPVTPGFWVLRGDPEGLTLSGFIWEAAPEPKLAWLNGDIYSIDSQGELVPFSESAVVFEHVAVANNNTGQGANNRIFPIVNGSTVTSVGDYASYSAVGARVSIQAPDDKDLLLEANYITLGTANTSQSYFFSDVTTPATEVYGTAGVFGQGSAAAPATALIPAGTLVNLAVRSANSAQNQVLQAGSSIRVTAVAAAAPIENNPQVSIASIGAKLKTAIDPALGTMDNLVPNGPLLSTMLGEVSVSANGTIEYDETNRSQLDDGAADVWIYARAKFNPTGTTAALFGSTADSATFVPLSQVSQASGEVSRVGGNANSVAVRIDGDGTIANRGDMATATFTNDFVNVEIDKWPAGNAVIIGRHTQTNTYTFTGELQRVVVLDAAPSAAELKTIRHWLEFGEPQLAEPDVDEMAILPVARGVDVEAYPAWVGSEIVPLNIIGAISTGVNLLEIDSIIVHFKRSNGTWPASGRIYIRDILRGVPAGLMLIHYDTHFLNVRETTDAELAAGQLNLSAGGSFTWEVTEIEFRKELDVDDPMAQIPRITERTYQLAALTGNSPNTNTNVITNFGANVAVLEELGDDQPAYNGDGTWTFPEGRWTAEANLTGNAVTDNTRYWWTEDGPTQKGRAGFMSLPEATSVAAARAAECEFESDGTMTLGISQGNAETYQAGAIQRSTFTFRKVTNSTVIGSVTELTSPAEVVEFPETTGLGFATVYTLENGRTWEDLKADYAYLIFNFGVAVTGVTDRVLRSIRVKAASLQDATVARFEFGSANVDIAPGVLTGGDFELSGDVVDDVTLEIVGEKARAVIDNPEFTEAVPIEYVSIYYKGGETGYVGNVATTQGGTYQVADLSSDKLATAGQSDWVVGNTIVIPRDADYDIAISASDTTAPSQWGLYVNGLPLTSSYTGNGGTQTGSEWTIDITIPLSAGDVLEYGAASPDNAANAIGSLHWKVSQRASEQRTPLQVVPINSVPVEPLASLMYTQTETTAEENIGSTAVQVSNASILFPTTAIFTPNTGRGAVLHNEQDGIVWDGTEATISEGGRYDLTAILGLITNETGNLGRAQLVLNGATILDTAFAEIEGGANIRSYPLTLKWSGELSAGDKLDIRMGHNASAALLYASRLVLDFKQSSALSVVRPEDAPVNDTFAADGCIDIASVRQITGTYTLTGTDAQLLTFTKPFGAPPTFVMLQYDNNGADSGDSTISVDMSSATATGILVNPLDASHSTGDKFTYFAVGLKP